MRVQSHSNRARVATSSLVPSPHPAFVASVLQAMKSLANKSNLSPLECSGCGLITMNNSVKITKICKLQNLYPQLIVVLRYVVLGSQTLAHSVGVWLHKTKMYGPEITYKAINKKELIICRMDVQ